MLSHCVIVVAALAALVGGDSVAAAQTGTPPPFLVGRTYTLAAGSEKATVTSDTGGNVTIKTIHFVELVEAQSGTAKLPAFATLEAFIKCSGKDTIGPIPLGTHFITGKGLSDFNVNIPIPPGLPEGECLIQIASKLTFADGETYGQFVNHPLFITPGVFGQTSLPPLELEIPPLDLSQTVPPSGTFVICFNITNNSDTETFVGNVIADIEMTSDEPDVILGENTGSNGPYSISDPSGGDTFPFEFPDFGDDGCFSIPTDPWNQLPSTIIKPIQIDPGETQSFNIFGDTYPLSPNGSAAQVDVRAEGTMTSWSTVVSGASAVRTVDTLLPPATGCPGDVVVATALPKNRTGTPGIRMDIECEGVSVGQIAFRTDESAVELSAGGAPFGGTTQFSGPGPTEDQFGRLFVEISFLEPLGDRDALYCFTYPLTIDVDDANAGEIVSAEVTHLRPGPNNGLDPDAPTYYGTVRLTMQSGEVFDVFFNMQLSADGIEDGSFAPVEMNFSDLDVTANGNQLLLSMKTSSGETGTPLIGYSTTLDLRGVVLKAPDTCPVDLNDDGDVNFFDVQEFLTLFSVLDPQVDLNGDGDVNFFDVQTFLIDFQEGCP